MHEPLFVPRTTPVKRLFLTFKQKKVHMAIVVSEYGKVLGLVTMDDLLAQIFGVLRDERAELQNTIPPGRGPARIFPEARADDDSSGSVGAPEPAGSSDAVARVRPEDDGADRGEDPSGPGSQPDASPGVLDPPPRPVHDVDEITPPATDLGELERERERGERGRS